MEPYVPHSIRDAIVKPRPLRVRGAWHGSLVLGRHNAGPPPAVRGISINQSGVALTALGSKVYAAKYKSDLNALSELCALAADACKALEPVDQVFFVPPRDCASHVAERIAHTVALSLLLPQPRPAFDWLELPWFRKGAPLEWIRANLSSHLGTPPPTAESQEIRPPLPASYLVVDDSVWSGSTLNLAALYFQHVAGPFRVLVFALTEVCDQEGDEDA